MRLAMIGMRAHKLGPQLPRGQSLPTAPTGSGGPGAGGQQWWRLAAGACAGVVAVAGLATAALPSVLSTQWGLQQSLELLNQRLPGRVEVAEARLSWLGGNELQCVKVYDSPRGGTILLHLNKVSTSSSLWGLLAGSGDYNLVISKPWINAQYDPRLSDFKLLAWAEKAGLLGEPQPPPAVAREQRQRALQRGPAQGQVPPPASPGAPPPSEPQAPPPPSPQQQKQQQKQPGGMAAVLARINSKMDFNADVRLGRAAVVVADGMLLVPVEIREALGPSLHVTGALGARQLAEWGGEVGEDVSWATGAAASAASAEALLTAAAATPAVTAPPADVLRGPADYRPGVVQIHSQHLAAEMRLWQHAGGGASLLHQPATARLELTPALSKLGFGSANPVLGDAVEARGGQRLQLSFLPEGGRLPYTAATVEMAPIDLSLGATSLLTATLAELGLPRLSAAAAAAGPPADGAGGAGGGGLPVSVSRMVVRFWRDGELRTERVDMRLGGGGGGGGGGGSDGGGSDGVGLAVWGAADLLEDRLDFTLGVDPEPLLGRLGLSAEGLPEGYLLLVPLRGGGGATPVYDVAAAARRLGQLVARQKAAQWAEGRLRRQQQQQDGQEAGGEEHGGGGGGAGGLLASGLHAVLSAVQPEGQLRSAIDRELSADCERIPPPLPPQGQRR
ncbi:hypothetical protein GPECTOR_128g547 [Gonium pectorale]|uniref:Uncharacterized protein n=1 Tax=Gonium pectorale TaxID=33097 RepID=A0A150FYF6_GONPE|nr:hypothetical protein GPECTOR_128g547 [Gonium pectorale]|eukprot:KXZ42644.1 hypothetical protein GPECTOR_128g547 [Gonium pectorale]